MYSRSMGRMPYSSSGSREPSYRQELRVPPNYSGTAIGNPPPDGVSPATDGVLLQDPSPTAVTSEEASDRETEDAAPRREEPSVPSEAPPSTERATPTSLGGFLSGQGFPFGHGFGFEELLLLGLILFLLREGEGSGEDGDLSMTLLLLGALLLCG